MLDKKIQDALNAQINWEFYSGYLYLSMAAQFAESGMPGGQNWMTVQYQEELTHAQKMFDYVTQRGGRVWLEAIAKPAGPRRGDRRRCGYRSLGSAARFPRLWRPARDRRASS